MKEEKGTTLLSVGPKLESRACLEIAMRSQLDHAADINTIFVLLKRAIRAVYDLRPMASLGEEFKEEWIVERIDIESGYGIGDDMGITVGTSTEGAMGRRARRRIFYGLGNYCEEDFQIVFPEKVPRRMKMITLGSTFQPCRTICGMCQFLHMPCSEKESQVHSIACSVRSYDHG
ncbi:hypothetical protein EVAR_66491_1 [Eumeta japonica]|uniref:Uncharacterized protein n=1 Tax=Eumeta variegata TaxID=151549 RepID=A0A4C2AH01_EUMVA|nr:hypothetical protein EVAR_66491_1 [Eumeta japonica]